MKAARCDGHILPSSPVSGDLDLVALIRPLPSVGLATVIIIVEVFWWWSGDSHPQALSASCLDAFLLIDMSPHGEINWPATLGA